MNTSAKTPLTLSVTALTILLASGCITEHYYVNPGGEDMGETSTGNEEGGTNSTTSGEGDDGPVPDPGDCVDALDILVVLDNSGSMGEMQANFVNALPSLIDPLDEAGVDWRLGVTTTDNGNPWCPPGQTTPEAGNLVMSSCRQRTDDFVLQGNVDATDVACNDLCDHNSIDILPTPTALDPTPSPRPWIERIGGQTNVANASAIDALACALPMGVNGCGFESPLESARRSLLRFQSPQEPSYGFMRADASLLVVIVSDEADCSYSAEWSEIFDSDGNKAFWNDPNDAFPTSAVCWRAGVECSGNPSDYDSCDVADKTVDGAPAQDPSDAVLYPVAQRYVAFIQDLEQAKQEVQPEATVRVSLVAGTALNGDTVYQDGQDADFHSTFGIGAGCDSGALQAVPPVRMRELSELTGGQQHSICDPNLADELASMVEPFVDHCG